MREVKKEVNFTSFEKEERNGFVMKIALIVLHLIIAVGLIISVLLQSSKSQGLSGSIAGGAETFFGKNKGKTLDGVLAKVTVILAVLFVITSVSISMISKASVEKEEEPQQIEQQVEVEEETPEVTE